MKLTKKMFVPILLKSLVSLHLIALLFSFFSVFSKVTQEIKYDKQAYVKEAVDGPFSLLNSEAESLETYFFDWSFDHVQKISFRKNFFIDTFNTVFIFKPLFLMNYLSNLPPPFFLSLS
jgi:hypothetical protein